MSRRNVPIFSHEQTERLIALNRQLSQLEYWSLLRCKSLVEDFMHRAKPSYDWVVEEDFEFECQILYYRTVWSDEDQEEQKELILQSQGFVPILPFKWYYLNPTPEDAASIFKLLHYNWNDGVEDIPRLNKERICWTFHDLYDHSALNWQQVLEVEHVWLDIHAVHQVEMSLRGVK